MSGLTLRQIAPIQGPVRRQMVVSAALGVAAALAALTVPTLAGAGVSEFLETDTGALATALAGIAAFLGLRLLFSVGSQLFDGRARFLLIRDLREQWFARILAIPPGAEGDTRQQEWVSLLSYDVPRVAELCVSTPIALVQASWTLVGALVLMALTDPLLTAAVAGVAPIAYLVARIGAHRMRARALAYWDLEVDVMNRADEAFRGRPIVQAFNQERRVRLAFNETAQRTEEAAMHHLRLSASVGPLTQFATVLGMIGVVGIAVFLQVDLGPGELLAFVLYGLLLTQPLRAFADGLSLWHEASATLGRFDAVSAALAHVPTPGDGSHDAVEGRIELREVTFSWRDEPLFERAHLVIAAGEHVALVGPNGVGKTTLISLLLGFIEPAEGTIEVDGIDLATLTNESRRAMFAVVPQHANLLGRTVRECVSFGRPGASTREIRDALDAALALEFVDALPDGLDTAVGEDGVRLSGGERQRLAVARALLLDAPIIILDEPTASYDELSTRRFVTHTRDRLAGKTIIWVTHESAPLEGVDRVVRLERGRFRAVSEVVGVEAG